MEQLNTIKPKRGRPRLDSKHSEETKRRIIWAGVEIITEKGATATGIDQILKKIDIPKGSFYHYFKSKDDYLIEVIQQYNSYFIHKLCKYFNDQTVSPVTRIVNFTEDAKNGIKKFQFKRGCLVGNMGQESSLLNEALIIKIEESFRNWEDLLEKCLLDAKKEKQIKPDIDCATTAKYFWIGWEGAVLRARLHKSLEPVDIFTEKFLHDLKI